MNTEPTKDFIGIPCISYYKPIQQFSKFCSHSGKPQQVPLYEQNQLKLPTYPPTSPGIIDIDNTPKIIDIDNSPKVVPINNILDVNIEPGLFFVYTVYLSDPAKTKSTYGTTSTGLDWDYAISISAKHPQDVVDRLPNEFKKWNIVRIYDPYGSFKS